MEIVKKNIVSIICGVVALACVAVWFFVLTGQQAELQAKLDSSAATHKTLADLLNKPRQLPTVDPDKPTEEKLTKFPSPKVIEQGEAITKKVEAESTAMRDAAVAMNKHTLLQADALPAPRTFAAAAGFRNKYQLYFPGQTQGVTGMLTANPLSSQLAKDLNAGTPPTPEEIVAAQTELANKIRSKELYYLPNGQPGNLEAVNARIAEATRKLPEDLRNKVAESKKIYINPGTFTPYQPILTAAGAPPPLQIYLAQLSLWLQQDIVAGVNEANKSAKNIIDAPVKHLVRVTALPIFIKTPTPTNDADGQLPKEIAYSPTGRVCNGLYDVFHVEVEADVEAAKLPDFLRALSTNRFITPLHVDVTAVDSGIALSRGHVYGPRPVVNVKVKLENLYLRKWNAPLMPKEVRTGLGIPDEQPGATPAAPTPTAAAQ